MYPRPSHFQALAYVVKHRLVTGAEDAVDYVRQRILDDIENNPMNSKEEKEEKIKQVKLLAPHSM